MHEADKSSSASDPRWQLIQRILASPPFQKSLRLHDLLSHMASFTIQGRENELTEQLIGTEVFGKPSDYSPAEDSGVRVYVRQLRLRLHEYFNSEGHNEPLVVEVPKGSYALSFHPAQSVEKAEPRERRFLGFSFLRHPKLPFAIASSVALLLGVACILLWIHCLKIQTQALPPWPLSTLLNDDHTAQIVIADSNYSIFRLRSNQHSSIAGYLESDLMRNQAGAHTDSADTRIETYIAHSLLTSYADVFVATAITKMAGSKSSLLIIRSARDLRPRDLEQNNFIFVGSPASNPWVSLYLDQLNFQEIEENIGQQKYFRNRSPRPGEQAVYRGLDHTGASGTDYATISFLRNANGGNVLIIQGLQQEGTEAAGLFLTEESSRRQIRKALHLPDNQTAPVYFEVLLSTSAVNGAPGETSIVASRLLK